MELLINWHQTSLLFLFTICPQKYILLCNGHSIIHDQVATDALASNYTFLLELQLFSVEFFAKIKFWRTLFTESDMDSLAITSFVLWSDEGPKPMAGFKTKSLLRGSFSFGIWVETKWPVGFQMELESIRKLFENQLALLVGPTQNQIICVV